MSHYKSNLRDIEFNLFEVFGRGDILGAGPYSEMDVETAREILREVDRLAREELAESFEDGDRNPPVFDPETHSVTMPESFKKHYRAFMDAEWYRLELPEDVGGQPVPPSLKWSVAELVLGANPALHLYTAGPAFAVVVNRNGTERDKQIAQHMIDRQWGATMVLTEPDAGSDVGAGRTRATRHDDGSWHIEGIKRFITSAEHDLSENIIHLVLARPVGVEGVGGPGTKGLSLFVVPKYDFDLETGELTGERNGAYVTSVEHKMGIKVSTTCELTFGETVGGPAKGWLLGEVHDGIAQMFQVIENARMMVGTKAMATLSTGYLNALEYAKERVQGADLTEAADKAAPRVTITHHPDVRRSLMTQKSFAEAMRALVLYTATWQDQVLVAEHNGAADSRPTSWPRTSTTCCCRSSRATARSARGCFSAPSRCRRSAAPASCRSTRSSSTSATPRSTRSTRAPPPSRARTSSSARSSRTRARRWATWRPRSRLPRVRGRQRPAQGRARAARQGLEDANAIVGHMIKDLMSADAECRGRRAAQHLQGGPQHHSAADGARRRCLRLAAASPGRGRARALAATPARTRPSTRARSRPRSSSRRPTCRGSAPSAPSPRPPTCR